MESGIFYSYLTVVFAIPVSSCTAYVVLSLVLYYQCESDRFLHIFGKLSHRNLLNLPHVCKFHICANHLYLYMCNVPTVQ